MRSSRLSARAGGDAPLRRAPPALALLLLLSLPAAAARPARAAEPPLPDSSARRWQTGMLRADRVQHASLSFTISIGAGLALDDPLAGAGLTLGIGLAKEIADARRTRFDAVDLVADAIGAALGAAAVKSLDR
jgi:hypothetical protein